MRHDKFELFHNLRPLPLHAQENHELFFLDVCVRMCVYILQVHMRKLVYVCNVRMYSVSTCACMYVMLCAHECIV